MDMKEKTMARPVPEEKTEEYAEWAEWCNNNRYYIADDHPEYYYCKKIETSESEEMAFRIDELKNRLAGTDYQAIKYAEGYLTEDEYAETKVQRQAWRNEVNALEAQLTEMNKESEK